jgi:myo-inositol 2-dehydrogenase/D-chiro-inositol 1-dehydrogenase
MGPRTNIKEIHLMQRRVFIRTTATTVMAAALCNGRVWGQSPSETIQLGVIGCGRQARNNILNFMAREGVNGTRFMAVCDVDRKRARKIAELIEQRYREAGLRHRVRIHDSAEALVSDPGIDAVQIATPDHTHAALAMAAVAAGKDVYLEKPLTYTIAEGQALVRAVRAQGRVLQTGSQQRSSGYFHTICQLAAAGRLGQIEAVEVRIPTDQGEALFEPMAVPEELDYAAWLGTAQKVPYTEKRVHPQADYSRPGWMQIEDYGHGMITNWGAHMLDVVQWGLRMDASGPVEVQAEADYPERGIWNVHTRITGTSRYANGVELRLVAIPQGSPEQPGVRFIGTEGWAKADRGQFEASDRELLRWRPGDGEVTLKRSSCHYQDFIQAIRSRTDPVAPVEVGHRSNTLCLLHAISAKLGRPVRWDPRGETFVDDPEAQRFLSRMQA